MIKPWFGMMSNGGGGLEKSNRPTPLIESEARLKDWLNELETRLEKTAAAYNNASFNKYIGRPAADLNQYDAAFSALLSEPSYRATVQHWLNRAGDPLLQRRLMLFERAFIEAEVSKSQAIYELRNIINDRLITYRPILRGQSLTRSDITEALRSHPDRARRQQVYEQALRPLAVELEPQVQELMQRRNSEAQRLGYATYADLHLELLNLDRAALIALFDQLESLTDEPYRAFLEETRHEHELDRVEPWDLHWLADRRANLPDYPFRQEQIGTRVNELLSAFGINPLKLPIEVFKRDIPFGGLCFTIRVPDDVRIVANPKDGYLYYRTMFHEYGHAIHSVFNQQTNYFFKREWGIFSEGMAEILAYFTQYDEWLSYVTGFEATDISRYKRENSGRRLLRIRNLIAQSRFELEAYDNPSADLGRLSAEMEARYLMIPLNLTPRWAAVSFPTTHPIYRQNYLIAELIAAQTHAEIRRRFGSFFQLPPEGRAAVFNFLKEQYFTPGASLDWNEKIRLATGQPLSADALVAELGLINS